MTAPYCAVCGNSVPMDGDHVKVKAEWVHTDSRNQVDDYVLHTGCAFRTLDAWEEPA